MKYQRKDSNGIQDLFKGTLTCSAEAVDVAVDVAEGDWQLSTSVRWTKPTERTSNDIATSWKITMHSMGE